MKTIVKKILAAVLICGLLASNMTAYAAGNSTGFTTSAKVPYEKIQSILKKYQDINPDLKGWLKVPGTNINAPIAQNTKNNNYYAARDWAGKYYPNNTWRKYADTANYLDYRAKLGSTWKKGTSKNIVIYGHNWQNLVPPYKSGKQEGYLMFAELPSYYNLDFAEKNPHIYFSTGENEGIWRVFCVAVCEVTTKFAYNIPNPSTENYEKLIAEFKARSEFNFDVDVNTTDRLLTLSTCTCQYGYNNTNQRFIVVARLLRSGESEYDPVKVEVNPKVKKPKF